MCDREKVKLASGDDKRCEQRAWFFALDLDERLGIIRSPHYKVEPPPPNSHKTREELESLFSVDSAVLSRILDVDRISNVEFTQAINFTSPEAEIPLPDMPDWLDTLMTRLSVEEAENESQTRRSSQGTGPAGLINIAAPLWRNSREAVRGIARKLQKQHDRPPFEADVIEIILFDGVKQQLLAIVERSLILELNVARLSNLLSGDTPADRYSDFCTKLTDAEFARRIWETYPVMARRVLDALDFWVESSVEFLERLTMDWRIIQAEIFHGEPVGQIVRVQNDAGDRHNGGRSVRIVEFAAGRKIVFKPRRQSIDKKFQDLLEWINGKLGEDFYKTINVLDCNKYGWQEFVTNKPCKNIQEVCRFFERQGGYLALLHTLEGTDFHCSNMVASGEFPVWIDLETLFHPNVGSLHPNRHLPLATRAMHDSVLSTGMLPLRIHFEGADNAVDMSGLTPVQGQPTPFKIPRNRNLDTDELHIIHESLVMGSTSNLPRMDDRQFSVTEFTVEFMMGFEKIYNLLWELKDELLAADGPVSQFWTEQTRIVLRPTIFYSKLIYNLHHPDLLHDSIDRFVFLAHLLAGSENHPYLSIISSERSDLEKGDIPIFYGKPATKDIVCSNGTVIEDFFLKDSKTLVEERFEKLGHEDLEKQKWFIRASISTIAADAPPKQKSGGCNSDSQFLSDEGDLLGAALTIGERLDTLSCREGNAVSWTGMRLVDDNYWSPNTVGIDLYDGAFGIALFLAQLGHIGNEERFSVLAEQAMLHACERMESDSRPTCLGAFDGLGGCLYALTHLYDLLGNKVLAVKSQELVERIFGLIEKDSRLDVVGGAAGCIVTLLGYYKNSNSDAALEAARLCGERLVRTAEKTVVGSGWRTLSADMPPLAGFSHGGAGIAWSLMELAAVTGESHFVDTALEAIQYERSLFSQEQQNWHDLRNETVGKQDASPQGARFMVAWCHGAPGIGLARLKSLRLADDPEFQKEIEAAIGTTLKFGFGDNHSLCHGDFGSIEFLLQARSCKRFDHLNLCVDNKIKSTLDELRRIGPVCAVPGDVETPGLMLGLAGVGHGLLRAFKPDEVPSVLVLDSTRN